MWYLSSFVWLSSLSIMPSRSIHVVADVKISFLFNGWIIFHCVYICHIFRIHLSTDGHSCCFQIMVIISNAAVNMWIHMEYIFFNYCFCFLWINTPKWTCWIIVVVQSLSCVWLFVTPWTAACQAPLSFIISQSLFTLMSIESIMPSNHLIFCHPLLLLP